MSRKKKTEKHVHVRPQVRQENVKSKEISGLWMLLVMALSLLAYIPSLQNGFVWDDTKYIENNPLITTIDLKALFSEYVMGNYHPLTMLSYALEYQVFGLDAGGYHAVNLALHLFNVFLVYYLINLLSRQVFIALVAALFFGIHPLHVESVAWASELKDLLYTLFFLASLIFYVKYIDGGAKKYFLFSIGLFLCSLLSKGMAVSLPVVLLFIDYFRGRKFNRQLVLEKIPFFILAFIFGVVAVYAQQSSDSIQDIERFPFFYRIAFASYGFVMYLIKLILPFQLSAFYPYPIRAGESLPASYYIFPVLALLIVGAVVYAARFSRKPVFALGFFAATVFLVLQLLPVGDAIMADRYSYVPSVGIFYLMGEGLFWLWNKNNRTLSLALAGIASVFFFAQTYARTQVWKDGLSLWTDVIDRNPSVAVAYNNRGGTLMLEKRYEEALADYNKAIELRADFYDAYNNRGILLSDLQRKQEALADYNKAIQFDSSKAEVFNNRGLLLMELGRSREALVDFNKSIQLQPSYAQAYYNRGLLVSGEGNSSQAYQDYETAIRLNPTYTEAYVNRGVLLHNENKLDEALVQYTKAMELQQDNPQVFHNRGLIMMTKKRYDEAISDFSRAIQLQKDYATAYYNRGLAQIGAGRNSPGCQDLEASARLGFQPAFEEMQRACR
jgi:tetratricopeptide (TPR) repeat protein